MTATDTDIDARFNKAIADAYTEAHKAGNIAVLCAMADRGFSLAQLALPTIFQQASAQKNVTQLETFVRCGITPGSLAALNTAEKAHRISLSTREELDPGSGLPAARQEFEKMARAAFNGDCTGLDRVTNAQKFDAALAKYDRLRTEPVSDVAKSWPI